MFLKIQSAYRAIENELDPTLKAKRESQFREYESKGRDGASSFKSRRGAKADSTKQSKDHQWHQAQDFMNSAGAATDYQEERFLRRYRMTHLRTKSNQPMSIRNYDRHGMENLAHDKVKPLDRLHIPPFILYAVVFSIFAYVTMRTNMDKGLNIE